MSNLECQKLVFITGIVILTIGCASKSDSTVTMNKPTSIPVTPEVKSLAIVEDGWGANPRGLTDTKDVNGLTDSSWYTKKYSGKANERSIELKSPSYMESTCRQGVKKENGKALIESAYNSLNVSIAPEVMSQLTSKITQEDLKNIEITNCKPMSPEKTFSECECALSYKVEGGKKAIMDKISPANK